MEYADRQTWISRPFGVVHSGGCLGSVDSDSRGTTDEETSTNAQGTTTNPLESAVANAPVPENSSEYRYATMGTGERSVVTYYGSWKCPYCAEFSLGFLNEIVTDYIKPTGLSLEFRGLAYAGGEPFLGPDAPRATRAGLAIWNLAPDLYWRYHEYVFSNQPPENEQWATTDQLITFARQAGIKRTDRLRSRIESGRYKTAVRDTAAAAQKAGIDSTPTLLIDGKTISPLNDPERTRQLLKQVTKG